jgi:hypothetical protein
MYSVTTQTLTVVATVKSNGRYSIVLEVMEGVYMKVGCVRERMVLHGLATTIVFSFGMDPSMAYLYMRTPQYPSSR